MAIGALSSIAAAGIATPALPTPVASATSAITSPSSGSGSFANSIGDALSQLEATQQKADGLAQQVASGDLRDVHDYMIAATEASVSTEFTLAIRNKVVDAFNQIMQMPV